MKTKYLEIKDYLSTLIEKGEDGGNLPSEHQLCEYMNASRVTVRRAVGELEADGYIKRQKGKGSFINKKPANKGTLNILLGIPEKLVEPETPIIGCINSIVDREIGLHIFKTRGDISKTVKRIVKHDIHGVIGIRPNELDYPIYEELRKRGYPVLLVDRIIKNSHYNYVSTDYATDGLHSTRFLIKKGHQRILFVGASGRLCFSISIYEGYLRALREHSTGNCQELTYRFPDSLELESFFKDAASDFSDKINNFDFSAVIVASGRIFAEMVMPAFEEHGIRIPEDIEVVVHDLIPHDCPVKKYVHELVQPGYEIGMQAIVELEKIVRGKKGKARVLFPSDFITKKDIRGTVK